MPTYNRLDIDKCVLENMRGSSQNRHRAISATKVSKCLVPRRRSHVVPFPPFNYMLAELSQWCQEHIRLTKDPQIPLLYRRPTVISSDLHSATQQT